MTSSTTAPPLLDDAADLAALRTLGGDADEPRPAARRCTRRRRRR
jgi:hypothetical protein